MRRTEALAELELGEYATPTEIKAAYRDLVKVWHPDRFGYDARLRQRAEERLQRINEAYRRLESGDFGPETEAPVPPSHPSEAWMGPPPKVKQRAEWDAELRGWMYLALFLVAGAFAGYAVVQHMRAAREAAETAATVQEPSSSAPVLSARAADDSSRATHRAEPAVRVMHLSERQMERMEAACGGIAPDSAEHAACARAQAAAMTGSVDMTGLTAGERTSVQHVCARAASYAGCAAQQIADLSTIAIRPDLSTLSARDRNAVARACASARDYDGPVAYDRCVVEFEKALAENGN